MSGAGTDTNPDGPMPPFKFDVPLWQVFIALFLIAAVLSGYKFFERKILAPKRVIVWQPFDVDKFQQEKRARRNILVWVRDATTVKTHQSTFQSPNIQAAVYLEHCVTYAIDLPAQTPADRDWIERQAKGISGGGVYYWNAFESQKRLLDSGQFNESAVLEWFQ